MKTLAELEKEIEEIKNRNVRVEKDKKWEQSKTRKIILVIFTYLAVGLYLNAIDINQPWLNAIVPSVGFLLSTLTLGFFKKLWEEYQKNE